MKLREKAKTIKIYIPALFVAVNRKDTPLIAKILAGITVVYALSPIDVIPDIIPILGYLDDLIILPLLVTFAIKFIPDEIMKECKVEAKDMWKGGKPKKWYYAMPIIVVWITILGMILSKIIK